jgi:neutral ceramidase
LGLHLKRASPFATTLIVTLANGAPGYIPTAQAFAEGSYETVNSRAQPGAGEQLVEAARQMLYELKEFE